jgi:hypothetical protein
MASSKDISSAKEAALEDAHLRESGFDPAAAPADAIAKLEELRSVIGISETSIVRALSKIPTTESAAMLSRLETHASGTARREIRRALFKLHQRGIDTPPAESTAPTAVSAASTEPEFGLSALLSPADGDGARVVWIMKSRPGAGLRRLWGLVSERDGLFGVSLSALTRKELRLERADLERRAGVALIEADWHLADFILSDAYRRTPESQRGEVRNFFAMRTELIAQSPPVDLQHPIYGEFAADLAKEASVELMKEPEVAAWAIDPATVKSYADEIASLRNSVIVLSRIQQEERIITVVERAISELLGGDIGTRLRRHLEDTAYYFARTGRRDQAAWAAAAAARLRDGADLSHAPFFLAFMRAQLGAIIAEEEQHQREEPRLIMTPAEAIRSQQAARARQRTR